MKEKEAYNQILLKKTVENLKKNFFDVYVFNHKEEVIEKLKEIIRKKSIIGYGGSRTLEEIGFFEHFNKNDYPNLLDRRDSSLNFEQRRELQIKSLSSDVFLSSANAISQSGDLVLIDKWGNRNAGLTFGPKKRIVIAGVNKITKDLESAIDRAKNKAAVLNNIRFNTKNPCVEAGKCCNCKNEESLCSVTTIISKSQPPKSIIVFLINEELGF
ncbi:MAG TPA: lactate utilization protein [Spirochaetota bacterium]|nr:lactate utilization protein [Spirochaetota bacterium]HOL57078.1 lactate utilization protein [Spirochaetota bacterium]HPP04666.1 lactate utilization protein [Spirochaetota bacterium]